MAGRARSMDLLDDKDTSALRKVVRIYGQDVDFGLFLHGLFRQGFIRRRKYETLLEIFNTITIPLAYRYELCLREIAQFMTLQNIVSVFNEIGLQDIAQAILKERYCEPGKQVQATECQNQDLIEKLYGMLLQKISSGNIRVSMHVDFQNITTYLISKLQQVEDIRTRQKLMDCLAVVVRIRGFILEGRPENEAILEELISVKESHKDLDHTVTTLVYLISNVYIERENNALDKGEACLIDVKQVCHLLDNPSFRALIYTAEQAFYRRIYSETSDITYQHKSLLACDNAVYSLVNTCESNMHGFDWHYNLLSISKVCTLMAFGKYFKIDHSNRPKQTDIESAKVILGHLKSKYSRLGNREKGMYHVCMARTYEGENSKLALSHAVMAIEFEQSAYFTEFEKQDLNTYIDYLKSIVR